MTTRQFVRVHPSVPWLLAAGCLLLAIVFAGFGAGVLHGVMAVPDRAVRDWIVEHRSAALVAVAGFVSRFGATEWLAGIAAVVGWILLRRGWAWLVLLVLCAMVSGRLVDILKDIFDVHRPPTGFLERESLSFPSGHSSGGAAVSLFMAYVIARKQRAPAVAAAASAIAVIVLVGMSRILLDMHWLSDVLGGWTVGTAVAIGFCAIWEWTQRYQRDDTAAVNPPGDGTTRR